MNKTTLIIIAAIVFLGGGAGAYFMSKDSSDPNDLKSNSTKVTSEEKKEDGDKFSGTFLELIALGQNYSCTYSFNDDSGNTTTGKVYIAEDGGKMSGEFEMKLADGNEMTSNVVTDGEYTYTWSSMQDSGFKMKVDPEDKSIFANEEDAENTGLSDYVDYDFDCSRWSIDESMFVPPADIEFTDLSVVIKDAEEMVKNVSPSKVDCSICDMLPDGSTKLECKQSCDI